MKTKLFTLLLAVAASIGTMLAWDYERVQIGNLYYNLDSKNLKAEVTSKDNELHGYSSSLTITSASIPSTVSCFGKTYKVTAIGNHAFHSCSSLRSITIPNSITRIDVNAFSYCTNLTSIKIPSSVTSIGGNAFWYCTGLTSVTIPNSVTSIGGAAFYYCSGLTSVTIGNSVTSIGNYVFEGCSGLTSITIPNSVTSIGYMAFKGCTSLPIENNIRYAGSYLVEAVNKTLSSYTIKSGTKWIGPSAFQNCSNLNSITIPSSVKDIQPFAFSGCTGLTSITIPNSVTSIGGNAFEGCSGLIGELVIPNSVTSIEEKAFAYCTGLTSITIPENITFIGRNAFSLVNNIVYTGSVTSFDCGTMLPPSISPWGAKSINGFVDGYLVYRDVTKTELLGCSSAVNGDVVIPTSVTSIGDRAFSVCTGLTSITIPNSVTSIGWDAFEGCSGLTSITIPNSVTSIGEDAFWGCSGLTSVTIGNSVTSIGEDAFWGCSGLTSVVWNAKNCSSSGNFGSQVTSFTFGEEVEVIPPSACSGMTNLTSITIPNSVTSIGDNAFNGCGGITSVIWKAHNSNAYNFGSQVTSFTFGNDVEIIPASICAGMSNLTSIIIPNSVTSIGSRAFSSCTGLTSVTINSDSVTNNLNLSNIFGPQVQQYIIGSDITGFGNNIFQNCNSLTSIVVDDRNSIYDSRNNCNAIIETATNTLISGCKNTVIPDNVTRIDNNAFYGCSGLTSVTIPNSVTSIGENAFKNCNNLTSVTIESESIISKKYTLLEPIDEIFGRQVSQYIIGDGITTIGDYAFAYCSGLTSVTIPNSVTSIGYGTFRGTNINIINFTGTLEDWLNKTWSQTSVSSNYKLLLNGVLLESIIFPNSVTSIGDNVISGCSGLTSVTIPNSVTNIGNNAFYGCSGLTSVTIPNSVTSIGESAFQGCSGLTSVTIPNSVTSIGESAFQGCSGLTSVTIPNSVTSIGGWAFFDCTGLTSVTIGNSVTSIGKNAFYGCSGLTKVNITDIAFWLNINFRSDYSNPLYYARNLYVNDDLVTDLVIPNSVTSIGGGAFAGCSSLTSVTIPNSVTSIGEKAFAYCTGLTSVKIPNSVTSIGKSAFADCTGLTSVTSLATTPPTCPYYYLDEIAFSGVDCSNIPLYVPMESVSLYQAADIWKEFNVIGIMLADEVETAVFSATPTDDFGVILEWQAVENAILYNIDIIQGNDTIRKLQFDSNGKLLNSPSNAPSRYPNIRYTSTAVHSGNGWRYELNDLDPGTNYTYSITVKAENGSVLYTQSIGFTTKAETFIIKFVNWNGEELLVLPEVVKGTTPSYTGETPVRPNTAEYTYTFAGWDPAIVAVTGDATYKATFTATKNSYTITWQDENGSLIDQTTVEYGQIPAHADPVKQNTAEYTYTFAGWTPAVVAVTGDATYKATFSATKNSYTITWQNEDGSLIDQTTVEYGQIPAHADPVKQNTAEYTYTFSGWTPAVVAVTGDATYKATFSSVVNVYTISVSAVNGQVIGGGEYQYGATIDLTAIPNEGYVFDQWSDGVKDNPRTITVTGDAEYTALFTSTEGFENIYTLEPVQKVIIDQQVYILRGEKVYTLQGQETIVP